MDPYLLSASVATALVISISVFAIYRQRLLQVQRAANKPATTSVQEPNLLCKALASSLPESVIFPQDSDAFRQSMSVYWAKQECEVVPACVVRPREIMELSTAVTILKRKHDELLKQASMEKPDGLFAIRSGGHSPVAGSATLAAGVMIDLSLFCEVTPSEDGSSVVLGSGARWRDVSKVLDSRGLAVVGGRNSAVGVGGFLLGGGLSFFSPRFGMACSNIISYELVLASGSITTASRSTNPDLWRALKGGSNNFGIVTRFTLRSFPSTQIWSGFLYLPAFQAPKVLAAFHEFVNRTDSEDLNTYDSHAAGPLTSFTYSHKAGFQVVATNLVSTKLPGKNSKYSTCWETSSFTSLWRIWSTCKVRSITDATDELNSLNPPGRRQAWATTTIKNDLATLVATHAIYLNVLNLMRPAKVKDVVWTLVLQPLLPLWVRKGDANPLGLNDSNNDPLVIVSFTVNWSDTKDDSFVHTEIRRAIEEIEAVAAANKTGHPWRYLNYCGEWQNPFKGYGEENWQFLKDISKKYDPEGLFQKGCVGGFKLEKTSHEIKIVPVG